MKFVIVHNYVDIFWKQYKMRTCFLWNTNLNLYSHLIIVTTEKGSSLSLPQIIDYKNLAYNCDQCTSIDCFVVLFLSQVVTLDMMEKINKELQCPICWNRLVQPKLLPRCQHTFCLSCISSYFQGCTNEQGLCPVCRTSFRLPRHGATALENNSIANRLLDITEAQ